MTYRTFRVALVGVVAALALAGCSGGGLTAEAVSAELGEVFPVTNPRDNTDFCAGGDAGCAQLITADPLSVYQWQTEADAVRHAEQLGDGAAQAGVFVVRFDPDYPSSDEAVAAYRARLQQVVTAEG